MVKRKKAKGKREKCVSLLPSPLILCYLALAGMVIFSIVTVSPFIVPVISTS
jgi:hypothetical protein